ncbi:MAG TPA: hypothetical protein VML96_09380 [Egibacteraceae bacterium]|nr:hypothetical protein [Egibacteraceae bacterium]
MTFSERSAQLRAAAALILGALALTGCQGSGQGDGPDPAAITPSEEASDGGASDDAGGAEDAQDRSPTDGDLTISGSEGGLGGRNVLVTIVPEPAGEGSAITINHIAPGE